MCDTPRNARENDVALLTFFDGGGFSGSGTSGGGASSGGTNVGEEIVNVLSLEGFSEKARPVGLDFVSGCLDDLVQFFFLYAKISLETQGDNLR